MTHLNTLVSITFPQIRSCLVEVKSEAGAPRPWPRSLGRWVSTPEHLDPSKVRAGSLQARPRGAGRGGPREATLGPHILLPHCAACAEVPRPTAGTGPPSGDVLLAWNVVPEAGPPRGAIQRRVLSFCRPLKTWFPKGGCAGGAPP